MPDAEDLPPFAPSNALENFIIFDGNRRAVAAVCAIRSPREDRPSPLILVGPPGSGKTYLAFAAGALLREREPAARILFVGGATFVSDLVRSVVKQTYDDFRARYRAPDLLLVDGVDQLFGKEHAQRELASAVGDLLAAGRRAVLTFREDPRELPRLWFDLGERSPNRIVLRIERPEVPPDQSA